MNKSQRQHAIISLILFVFNSFLELFTLGTAIPLVIYHISESDTDDLGAGYFSQLLQLPLFQNSITTVLLFLLGLLIIKNIVGTYITRFQIKLSYGVADTLGQKMLEHYFQMPYKNFATGNSGVFNKEINHLPITFAHKVLLSLIHILSELSIIILISIILFIVSPATFLTTSIFLVSISLLTLMVKKKFTQKIDQGLKTQLQSTSKALMRALDAYVQVRLHQKQHFFVDGFTRQYRILNKLLAKNEFMQTIPLRVLEFAAFGGMVLVVSTLLSNDEPRGNIAISLGLYATAAYRLIPSFNKIITKLVSINSSKHVIEILNSRLKNVKSEAHISPTFPKDFNTFGVENLCLEIESKPLFRDLSFSMNKGQILGIIAPSGFGKSSLLKVASGLITATQGSVTLNGRPIEVHNNPNWFEKIAHVDQHPLILDGSIAENIAFGIENPMADHERLRNVISRVGLEVFLEKRQNGLNEIVGENGLMLSGGERRRLELARALYKNPDIFLLDEVTNDLDSGTSDLIHKLIQQLAHDGKYVIWVTHDPKSLPICNLTLNLETGIIIERKPSL